MPSTVEVAAAWHNIVDICSAVTTDEHGLYNNVPTVSSCYR